MRQLKITQSITNRASAALDKYLVEIGREELITTDDEVELAQRIHKGDKRALDKLVRANLRFVVSVAKQYQTTSSLRATWALSRLPASLTRHVDLNSFPMLYGGFAKASCKLSQNRAALCACP